MSVKYVPVQWGLNKWIYDAVLLACVGAYIWIFVTLGVADADTTRPIGGAIVRMRAFGSCAFLMLTVILCIGPLARLDRRFLPLLYNRRHFGVITSVVALTHAIAVLDWYYAFSPTPKMEALLSANVSYGQLLGFPFEALGVFALIALAILAATSHDFWLNFLSPPVWKALHLLIYPAYAAVVAHVVLGSFVNSFSPTRRGRSRGTRAGWRARMAFAVAVVVGWMSAVARSAMMVVARLSTLRRQTFRPRSWPCKAPSEGSEVRLQRGPP